MSPYGRLVNSTNQFNVVIIIIIIILYMYKFYIYLKIIDIHHVILKILQYVMIKYSNNFDRL
jgi:hypothetical protein